MYHHINLSTLTQNVLQVGAGVERQYDIGKHMTVGNHYEQHVKKFGTKGTACDVKYVSKLSQTFVNKAL